MQRVARSAVHDGVVGEILTVVDEDGPEVDEDEEDDVGHLLQGEDERENVIRHGLGETVERVESMAGVRRRHDPLVVRLVKVLVDERVVEVAVDPVDAEVGKEEEQRELKNIVPHSGPFGGRVIQLGVATDLESHNRCGAECHERHGLVGLNDLEPDLVLDELGVLQGPLVEDEVVGHRGKEEVDN